MVTINTTCQVCGSAVRIVPGHDKVGDGASCANRVAHHGYTRPHGAGYQTASCFGARWRPYEEAADALPPAIEQTKLTIEHLVSATHAHEQHPPEHMTWTRTEGRGQERQQISTQVKLPTDFQQPVLTSEVKDLPPGDYARLWWNLREELLRELSWTRDALHRLERRLKDWTPPPG